MLAVEVILRGPGADPPAPTGMPATPQAAAALPDCPAVDDHTAMDDQRASVAAIAAAEPADEAPAPLMAIRSEAFVLVAVET